MRSSTGSTLDTGVASWYGSKFHGKMTANGETYNMNDLTAAHRSLPFNTVVKVTNLDNGKTVRVRINDRGPYVDNRVIDLSREAARKIDMESTGVAQVRLELVREGDRAVTRNNARSVEQFTVQLASFNTRDEARNSARQVRGARVVEVKLSNRTVYRVYYGTYGSKRNADRAQRRLARHGHDGFVKQLEN